MTPERFHQIQALYEAALSRGIAERNAFLDASCHDDEELRRAIDSLLELEESAATFMESGALAVAAQVMAVDEARRSLAGKTLSHYQIAEEIGRGGMGVVYRAFDTKLRRDVALKVLTRGQRLWREARAAASLKHPNIGVVYEVGEADDVSYLAMELLEGESLAETLKRGQLSGKRALEIATQVAEGLAHAHERGVVHRDLKPANIMLTAHGPKIIDFGIAGSDRSLGSGRFMGTLSYVSPEQASGASVDARSDIFSFGVVLGDMLRGATAHGRLHKIADRCRAERREDRYPSARDLVAALRKAQTGSVWWRWVAAAGALATIVLLLRDRPDTVQLTNPVQITSSVGVEENPQWSPDGRTLAFQSNVDGNWDIWITEVDGRPTNRTADHDGADRYPSWSPDGSRIAFSSDRDPDGIFVMPAFEGMPRRVASGFYASAPQWSSDGNRLAVVVGDSADIVSLETGGSERLPLPGRNTRRFDLSWSRDERFLAYIDANAEVDEVTTLWAVRISDETSFQLTDGRTNVWSPSWSSDALYFVSNRGGGADLWRQRFTPRGPDGEPEQLTVGIGIRNAALSSDGKSLAYSKGRRVANLWRIPADVRRPGWWAAEQLTFDQALIEFVDVSPNGQRLAVSSDRAGNQDVWILPASGGAMTQLTTHSTPDWAPAWSPDGSSIAFYSYRSGTRDLWLISANGGDVHQLTDDESEDYRMVFSPDGSALAFDSTRSGSWDIWTLNLESRDVRQLTRHPSIDSAAQFSPDGRWIVFDSLRSGRSRLWRLPAHGGEPEAMTMGPARRARFSRDGAHIFFMGTSERAGNIWRLSLDGGEEIPMTDLGGRPGILGLDALATDGSYLYFTWEEDLADIWTMDLR